MTPSTRPPLALALALALAACGGSDPDKGTPTTTTSTTSTTPETTSPTTDPTTTDPSTDPTTTTTTEPPDCRTDGCPAGLVCDDITLECREPLSCDDAGCDPLQLCDDGPGMDAECLEDCVYGYDWIGGRTGCAPTPLPAGIVAHYGFEDAGDLAIDASGNGFHGTFVAGESRAYGPPCSDGAALIDHPNHIVVPYDPGFNLDGSFTFAAWIRPDVVEDLRYVVSLPRGPLLSGIKLGTRGANAVFAVGDALDSTTPLSARRWTHIAGTYDEAAGMLAVYVDGAPAGTAPAVAGNPQGRENLVIGAEWDIDTEDARRFLGEIDDVQVYDRALSADEVQWVHDRYLLCP